MGFLPGLPSSVRFIMSSSGGLPSRMNAPGFQEMHVLHSRHQGRVKTAICVQNIGCIYKDIHITAAPAFRWKIPPSENRDRRTTWVDLPTHLLNA